MDGPYHILSLFFSVDTMVFDFPYIVFFLVQFLYYWKNITKKDYVERFWRNFYIFFMEVIIWKEN